MDATFMMDANPISTCPKPENKNQYIPRTRWIPMTESMPEDTLPPDSERLAIPCMVARAGADNSVTKLMRQRYKKSDGTFSPWSWSRTGWNRTKTLTHWALMPKAPEK